MISVNVNDLAEEALNAACLVIQNRLGVTTGDVAAQEFSDGFVKECLIDYINLEIKLSQEQQWQ